MYNILIYEDENGESQVQDYLRAIGERARRGDKLARGLMKKIEYCIGRLENDGTRVGEPITKHIGGKVWELRPDDHRILFFGWNGNNIILLHMFRKETQKTPPRHIETAERRMNEFTARMERERKK